MILLCCRILCRVVLYANLHKQRDDSYWKIRAMPSLCHRDVLETRCRCRQTKTEVQLSFRAQMLSSHESPGEGAPSEYEVHMAVWPGAMISAMIPAMAHC